MGKEKKQKRQIYSDDDDDESSVSSEASDSASASWESDSSRDNSPARKPRNEYILDGKKSCKLFKFYIC
jgi:hypothetical protein